MHLNANSPGGLKYLKFIAEFFKKNSAFSLIK